MKTPKSLAAMWFGLLACTAGAVNIETVSVGNPGNAGRPASLGLSITTDLERVCGAVNYAYEIGKYEVTAGQYAEFLNAVAGTDKYGLYNTSMARSAAWGCNIQRSGSSGSYTYSVAADWANRPVNYVNYWDACRFANWLHNGQPSGAQGIGTTETGAYDLDGYAGHDGREIQRNANWIWAVTSEDEWYKAAFHKNDGATGNYFDFPTSSDDEPVNVLGSPVDPGNNATFTDWYGTGTGGYTIGDPYYRTEAGAHENSASAYGTYDQAGNVAEWNESVVYAWDTHRGLLGGSFETGIDGLHASVRSGGYPDTETAMTGFRVAHIPEPATIHLLGLGGVALLRKQRR